MDNPIIRRRKAESGLGGPLGLAGAGLGAVIGAFAGNPVAGASIGQQAGSIAGDVAKPAKEGMNTIQRRSSGFADQANGMLGAGLGLGGSIDSLTASPTASPGTPELVNFTPDMEQELYRQRFLRRRIG